MIIESFELINENLTINELTEKIKSGIYDDILSSYSMMFMTQQGLVKVEKVTKEVITNPTVDLSSVVKIEEGKTLIAIDTLTGLIDKSHEHSNKLILESLTEDNIDSWNNKANISDIPDMTIDENGILSITINNITHKYAPIIDTE